MYIYIYTYVNTHTHTWWVRSNLLLKVGSRKTYLGLILSPKQLLKPMALLDCWNFFRAALISFQRAPKGRHPFWCPILPVAHPFSSIAAKQKTIGARSPDCLSPRSFATLHHAAEAFQTLIPSKLVLGWVRGVLDLRLFPREPRS